MPYFMQLGDVPRKRFSQHRKPDGSLYATEVMGEEGFSADFSNTHRGLPRWVFARQRPGPFLLKGIGSRISNGESRIGLPTCSW